MADEQAKTDKPESQESASAEETQHQPSGEPMKEPEAGTDQSQAGQPAAGNEQAEPHMQETSSQVSAAEPPAGGRRKIAIFVIVFLLLALGAVIAGIISGQRTRRAQLEEQGREAAAAPTPTPAEEEDSLTAQYEDQSDSDEIADIESDLQATSFEGIDTELTSIDEEFSAQE